MAAGDSIMRQVTSRDGATIAYWTSGKGPPLVVVHGTPADHTRWRPLLPYVEPDFSIHAVDRRGRGASSDRPEYALEREFEDVAAVVDAVAEASGSAVNLYGHSHGGFCAFGAATLTPNIRKLVLYEGWPVLNPGVFALPTEVERRIDAFLGAGDRDAVVETIFRHYELMSDEDMKAFKAAPSWSGRVAAAHTIIRECRAEANARLDPAMNSWVSRTCASVRLPSSNLRTSKQSSNSFAPTRECYEGYEQTNAMFISIYLLNGGGGGSRT